MLGCCNDVALSDFFRFICAETSDPCPQCKVVAIGRASDPITNNVLVTHTHMPAPTLPPATLLSGCVHRSSLRPNDPRHPARQHEG